MQVLEEVNKAIAQLNLQDAVQLVDDNGELYLMLLKHFVEGNDRRWWWESFKEESESIAFEDGKGFERVLKIVPNPNEVVWFVVEDDQLSYYPIFECSVTNAVSIIGECFAFEYYLIPKSKNWLICENHHNYVIGVGSEITKGLSSHAM